METYFCTKYDTDGRQCGLEAKFISYQGYESAIQKGDAEQKLLAVAHQILVGAIHGQVLIQQIVRGDNLKAPT
jgi:hypothetical protein